ncbi:hypothetical protein FIBSPDRAFT_175721 [Athelia psychrophila]|uniref:Uncharacterized protein n=1 Tax=Athelia psychrophila TaxID=1759441 RepID=A0A166AL08_9AGAM|nr:hypothetical protein FIBSPDRAFT_175721 [Fibularhizoctonia sp. CBS 109695]
MGVKEREAVLSSWRAGIAARRVALRFCQMGRWRSGVSSELSQVSAHASLHRRYPRCWPGPMSFVRYHPLQICPRPSSRCTTRRPFQSSRGSSSTGEDAAWHRSSVIAFDNVDKLLGGGLGGRFFILPPTQTPPAYYI